MSSHFYTITLIDCSFETSVFWPDHSMMIYRFITLSGIYTDLLDSNSPCCSMGLTRFFTTDISLVSRNISFCWKRGGRYGQFTQPTQFPWLTCLPSWTWWYLGIYHDYHDFKWFIAEYLKGPEPGNPFAYFSGAWLSNLQGPVNIVSCSILCQIKGLHSGCLLLGKSLFIHG